MLSRFLSAARRKTASEYAEQDQDDAARSLAGQGIAFAPMVPVQPPEAVNDDSMKALYDAVEKELRAAGYLR
ncbi:hypothetical protein [Methylobacterium trifolii]|uniref:Uncharacterized protein n=1 Tax=Methylobacterium trifolii TaxID=1003092 RepID=A0ABQ4U2H6_9HYPH|nr:hypothetical protein [Methylobacterium trifolii]GJE61693.1 hypothetical protein MPOCJGCO_3816 [Methylobacterium trifolii]